MTSITMRAVAAAAAVALPALPVAAESILGLTTANTIVRFDSAAPATLLSEQSISGIAVGETLIGLDVRPANGMLYSLSTAGNLYSLMQEGGVYAATRIASLTTATGAAVNLTGSRFAIDFNPTVDRIRVLSDFDQNLRINPVDGVTIIDGTASGPGSESYVGAAYSNNFAGATSTQLYALDASGNQLALSTLPNAGTYIDVGVISGVDFGALNNVGFDISGTTGAAFFTNGNALYSLDLATAQATSLGTVGGSSLIGISVGGAVPEPATWGMMILGFGVVGTAIRRRRRVSVAFA